jgi:PilZ domain
MSTDPVHLERRAAQRFDFQLSVGVRVPDTGRTGHGFTRDLSGRGAFFYTDLPLKEKDDIELTLVMPSEITLTDNMRVCCRGKVTRVLPVEQKFGVAVHLEGYEFLPEVESSAQIAASMPRISALHSASQPERNPRPLNARAASADGSESGE